MANVMTHEKFIEKLSLKRPDFFKDYDLIGEYKNTRTKMFIKHKECGKITEISPMHIMRGHGCHNCFKTEKRTTDWFQEFIVKNAIGYTLKSEYVNGKTNVEMEHKNCGKTFSVKPENFIKGTRCPYCAREKISKEKSHTTSWFKEQVKQLTGEEYTVLGNYKNNKEKIEMEHCICGHKFKVSPISFLSKKLGKETGTRCPKCFGSFRKTTEQFANEVNKETNGEYELVSEYKNAKEKVSLRHKTCNKVFELTPINFHKGTRCPYCAFKSQSKKEKELVAYIRSIYDGIIETNKRFYRPGLNLRKFVEADVYIPNLNLVIEFNGSYWHSKTRGKTKKYHIGKTEFFEEKGIRCIHIFENLWDTKNEIVKKYLDLVINGKTLSPFMTADIAEDGDNILIDNTIILNEKKFLKYINKIEKNITLKFNRELYSEVNGLDNFSKTFEEPEVIKIQYTTTNKHPEKDIEIYSCGKIVYKKERL